MANLFKRLLRFFANTLGGVSSSTASNSKNTIDQNIDLAENISLDNVDLVIAINQKSFFPAIKLAKQKHSLFIVDIDEDFNKNLDISAQSSNIDIIFASNRVLATKYEKKLKRHIAVSRHAVKYSMLQKTIDIKKLYHLIDDTQLLVFDAQIIHSNSSQNLKQSLTFLAQLLAHLPRHIHLIITGDKEENLIFNQLKKTYEKYNCISRAHFYVEHLESIKYPISYDNIDLALLLDTTNHQTPDQYFKYLHYQVPIFTSDFADANQLIVDANIGQILNHQNAKLWAHEILDMLNFSLNKRNKIKSALKDQKTLISWEQESDHYMRSVLKAHQPSHEGQLNAIIVDISTDQITSRANNIGYMLREQNIEVSILTPKFPIVHSPLTSNIKYIKIS